MKARLSAHYSSLLVLAVVAVPHGSPCRAEEEWRFELHSTPPASVLICPEQHVSLSPDRTQVAIGKDRRLQIRDLALTPSSLEIPVPFTPRRSVWLENGEIVAADVLGSVARVSLDGQLRWETHVESPRGAGRLLSLAATADGKRICMAMKSTVALLDGKKGEIRGQSEQNAQFATYLDRDRHLAVADYGEIALHRASARHLSQGKPTKETPECDTIEGLPAVHDERLLLVADDGVHEFDPRKRRWNRVATAEEKWSTSPALLTSIESGLLWLDTANEDPVLIRLDLSGKAAAETRIPWCHELPKSLTASSNGERLLIHDGDCLQSLPVDSLEGWSQLATLGGGGIRCESTGELAGPGGTWDPETRTFRRTGELVAVVAATRKHWFLLRPEKAPKGSIPRLRYFFVHRRTGKEREARVPEEFTTLIPPTLLVPCSSGRYVLSLQIERGKVEETLRELEKRKSDRARVASERHVIDTHSGKALYSRDVHRAVLGNDGSLFWVGAAAADAPLTLRRTHRDGKSTWKRENSGEPLAVSYDTEQVVTSDALLGASDASVITRWEFSGWEVTGARYSTSGNHLVLTLEPLSKPKARCRIVIVDPESGAILGRCDFQGELYFEDLDEDGKYLVLGGKLPGQAKASTALKHHCYRRVE